MPRRPCRDAKRLSQNGGNRFCSTENSAEPPFEWQIDLRLGLGREYRTKAERTTDEWRFAGDLSVFTGKQQGIERDTPRIAPVLYPCYIRGIPVLKANDPPEKATEFRERSGGTL